MSLFSLAFHMGISFFLTPFIVKNLGEEANGYTQLANNFVSYATLITLAFNSMAGRFVSVHYNRGEMEKAQKCYSSSIISSCVLGVLFIVAGGLIVWRLEDIIHLAGISIIDAKVLFSCAFLLFIVNLVMNAYSCAAYVTNRIYITNVLSVLNRGLNVVLLLLAFTFLRARVYYVSLCALVVAILQLLPTVVIQRRLLPDLRFRRSAFSLTTVKEMLRSGIWNTVNQCGNMLMTGLDLILCNLFISPSAMGVLSVAKTMPNAITQLAGTVNSSFSPSLVIDWAKGDRRQILQSLRSSMKISGVLLSITIMTFYVASAEFYTLWMPSLDARQLSMLSVLSCMAFVPLAGPQVLYNVFTATNKLKVNTLSFLACGVLNVAILYPLLKHTDWGIYAVAGVSSALTILRNLIIVAPYTAKLLQLKWYTFYRDVGISLLCSGINFAIALAVSSGLPFTGWLGLIAKVGIAVCLEAVVDLLVVLNKRERQMFLKKCRILK